AALAREREALWERTVFDERFMRALALANPSLFSKVVARRGSGRGGSGPERGRPNKRARHLDTTLYRLLARGVGRTEPFGAWAGVGVVRFGAETRLRRVAPARFVAPDL